MSLKVDEIIRLYEERGAAMYGSESVSQLEHALQCAALGMGEDASSELVAAALLHDLGHLVTDLPHRIERDVDDVHQYLAVPFLRGTFPDAVIEPIRLHVDAKRYLCRAESSYWAGLSPASRHSLELQGGVFSDIAAERFLARPYAWDAVRLRRWDDQAKVPGLRTPSIRDMEPVLRDAARASRRETFPLLGP